MAIPAVVRVRRDYTWVEKKNGALADAVS